MSQVTPIARSSLDAAVQSSIQHQPEFTGSVSDAFSKEPITVHREPYQNIDRVIQKSKELVQAGKADERIRKLALQITSGIQKDRTGNPDRRDFDAVANAIYNWMKANISYVRDQHNIERLQAADVSVRMKSGDCDCMTILAASLLQSLGVNTRFKLISTIPEKDMTHIFLQYFSPKKQKWVDFDVTLGSETGHAVPEQAVTDNVIVNLSDSRIDRSIFDNGNNISPNPDDFDTNGKTGKIDFDAEKAKGVIGFIGGVVRFFKGLFGGGKDHCTAEKEDIRKKLGKLLLLYTNASERQRFIRSTGSSLDSIEPTPSGMARFFIGGGDCLHKNVSPEHQRFLDKLPKWVLAKREEKLQSRSQEVIKAVDSQSAVNKSFAQLSEAGFSKITVYILLLLAGGYTLNKILNNN